MLYVQKSKIRKLAQMRKSAKSRITHCFLKTYWVTFNRYVTVLDGRVIAGFAMNRHVKMTNGMGISCSVMYVTVIKKMINKIT